MWARPTILILKEKKKKSRHVCLVNLCLTGVLIVWCVHNYRYVITNEIMCSFLIINTV